MYIKPTLEEVADSYRELREEVVDHHQAVATYAATKRILDVFEAEAIAAGIEGKNEKERAANLRNEFSDVRVSLVAAEKHMNEAKLRRDLAQLRVDEIRLQIRLMECLPNQQ